ncbi:DUF6795 domain-containing protein [Thaumasiovibrio sp. DFM-14]|uniref:DUF6795 domain-containing protein n=1 Tax=Thaumasiovibrio sp. DFM-14 TaxID=3384792 RepID=UPI00399F29C8
MTTFARALCFITIFISFGSHSKMLNFLKPYAYKICPEVHGVIRKMGEPYPNLKLTLHVEYGDSYFVHNAFTDDNGRFSFDEVIMHRWFKPFVLNNNVVAIELVVNFNGHERHLWASYIGTLTPKQFITDNMAYLDCDLDSIRYEYHFENEKENGVPYNVYGICELKGYIEKTINDDDHEEE